MTDAVLSIAQLSDGTTRPSGGSDVEATACVASREDWSRVRGEPAIAFGHLAEHVPVRTAEVGGTAFAALAIVMVNRWAPVFDASRW